MEISVIIVNWNTEKYLEKCLEALYALGPSTIKWDTWVVDNASSDGSTQMVEKKFPTVNLIKNDQNVGFARANNQAIAKSSGRYIWLLNSDTEIKPKALDYLYNFMEGNPSIGAAGSMLLNPDKSLQVSCYPLPTLSKEFWRLLHLDRVFNYGIYNMDNWDRITPRNVDVIQGASMLLRRDAIDQVGSLDKDYFMYTEEVDLCYRLNKDDWQVSWVPKSQVLHHGGQSTQQIATKMFLSLYQTKALYFRKNHGNLAAGVYKLILLIISLIRIILSPLIMLKNTAKQEQHQQLAKNYLLLIKNLPTM